MYERDETSHEEKPQQRAHCETKVEARLEFASVGCSGSVGLSTMGNRESCYEQMPWRTWSSGFYLHVCRLHARAAFLSVC